MKFVVGALVLVVVATAPAMAANKQRAREEFRTGLQHYNLGEYKDALETFKSAYRDYGDPSFLFNIAQCERMLGEKTEAIRSYRAFLREVGETSQRTEVLGLIASLEQALRQEGSAKAQPPSGVLGPREAEAADTRRGDSAGAPATGPVAAGAPAAGAAPAGTAAAASVPARSAPSGASSSLGAPDAASPDAASPDAASPHAAAASSGDALTLTAAPARRPAYKKWWVWTLAGIGVAGAAVGVALAVTLTRTSYPSAASSDGTFRF